MSVLSPTFIIPADENQFQINSISNDLLLEWRQILDLLWSDPKQTDGCEPNTYRGGGCYWGPDVTEKILEKHHWSLLIRSHECKEEGFGYTHNKKVFILFFLTLISYSIFKQVLTIFSASNYYAVGSNRGAYVKLTTNQAPLIVEFMATRSSQKSLTLWERLVIKIILYHRFIVVLFCRVSYVEDQALKDLIEKFTANKSRLMKEFTIFDPENTGKIFLHIHSITCCFELGFISVNDWCDVVTHVLDLQLPWRTLKPRLVETDINGFVLYESTFRSRELKFTLSAPVNQVKNLLKKTNF